MNKEVDINRLNYESFVIDYIDGKLDAVETACFIAFLENNPAIKDDVAELSDVKLITDDTTFVGKSILKKHPIISIGIINEANYEEFFIAHYEGDLKKSEEDILVDFLAKNTALTDEFKLFGSLQVQASNDVFVGKKSLKRKSYIGVFWYSSVAAAILLFMASWFFLGKAGGDISNKIATLSKMELRNPAVLLSSNPIVNIETIQRQVEDIPQFNDVEKLDNAELVANREVFVVSHVESKVADMQLVDSYIYSRIVEPSKSSTELTTEVFNTELAFVEPTDNNRKSLFARVFSNQLLKIKGKVKTDRNNREKLSDPTYVKVIDGGLLVFNTITGGETSTVKTYNHDGNITGYQIEGREVMFNGNFGGKPSSN